MWRKLYKTISFRLKNSGRTEGQSALLFRLYAKGFGTISERQEPNSRGSRLLHRNRKQSEPTG